MKKLGSKYITEIQWVSFIIPALLIYTVFTVLPTISAIYYSFTDWNGVDANFIGFNNYVQMFKETKIVSAFMNTIFYALSITILQNTLGLIFAIFMYKKVRGISILRMMYFMPAIFSSLIIGYIWGFILEPNIGVLNNMLEALHLGFLQNNWLGDATLARFMIVIVTSWQFFGYSMVIYIAGLNAIPLELYEAGDIDGVNLLQKFRHITFPLIAPSVTLNVVLCSMGTLKLFDQIFSMTGGGPGYETNSVASIIYLLGFGSASSRWGYGTALSITLFIFILILTIFQIKFLRGREVEM